MQSPSSPAPKPPRRHGLLVSVVAAAVGILLATLLWMSRSSDPRPPDPAATTAAPPGHPASSPQVQTPPVRAGAPPETSGPRAARVTFARDVKGILPVEEGDTFYRDDRKVILWVRWANIRGRHTTVTRWFNPDG